ncbi:single-stranded DNA-binding protein [Corynebacterium segmentosum]
MASSDKYYDQDKREWVQTRALYVDVTIWNESGERKNPTPWAELAAELKKGDQVAVTGKLVTRSWETKDGEKRSKVEFQALRFYRMPTAQQGQTQQPQQQGGQTTNSGTWATQPAQAGQQDQAPPF